MRGARLGSIAGYIPHLYERGSTSRQSRGYKTGRVRRWLDFSSVGGRRRTLLVIFFARDKKKGGVQLGSVAAYIRHLYMKETNFAFALR